MFRKKLQLYKSLDTLSILTFWNVLKDKNVLLIDLNYQEGKKYKENQLQEIQETWLRLYDEYFVLRDDSKSVDGLKKGFEKLKISTEIIDVKNNYDFLVYLKSIQPHLPKEDFLKHEQKRYASIKLINSKIKLDLFGGIDSNLNVLTRVLNSMQNTYNIYHKQQDKKIDDQIKYVHNVYDDVTNMEGWLGKDTIPIESVVVSKWISYEKTRDIKIKNSKKNGE